jgi:aminoglycoside phosphotransferase (APT) family kinase protein
LTTDRGDTVFVKIGSARLTPNLPEFYRREWRVATSLPDGVPAARPLWMEEGGGWITLAFEAIPGRNPPLPWRREDLERVLRAHERMSRALTPSPVRLPRLQKYFGSALHGFRTLHSQRGSGPKLPPWVERHLPQLAEWEGQWEKLATGSTLLHNDVRADNIVMTRDAVYFVDWPHACIGPAWFDLMGFLPSVAMQGGPAPWKSFDRSALVLDASPEAIRALLTATAGLFVERSRQPPPPGLPTLRGFQRAQEVEALRWLRQRAPGLR